MQVLLTILSLGCGSAGSGDHDLRYGRMRPWGGLEGDIAASAGSFPADWSRDLGIFEVRGHPCHYLRLATLYRRANGRWQRASDLRGPWLDIDADGLPIGFRRRAAEAACDTRPEETEALATL